LKPAFFAGLDRARLKAYHGVNRPLHNVIPGATYHALRNSLVMAGLIPAIHVFTAARS